MKSSQFLYVANWKMQLSFEKALSFCWENKDKLEKLSALEDLQIVLCPSFGALHLIAQMFKDSPLSVGAQNCSAYEIGAYTGEVSAASLAQIGCKYCIVGHSERRTRFSETDQDVALKVERLLENGLYPIVCVGETKEEREQKKTEDVIDRQVGTICKVVQKKNAQANLCIAYEPVWAIGTGFSPSNNNIESVFYQIKEIATKIAPEASISLLYGGSVSVDTAEIIRKVKGIKGFLIGGASIDFQNIEKIVT